MSAAAAAPAPALEQSVIQRFPIPWAKGFFTVLSDVAALVTAIAIAHFGSSMLFSSRMRLEWHLVALIPTVLAALWITELYSEIAANSAHELRRILCATTVVFAGLAFFERTSSSDSGAGLILCWAGSFSLLAIFRSVTRSVLARRSWWGTPTVILGAGDTGWRLASILGQQPSIGLKVIAVLDDGSAGFSSEAAKQPGILRGRLSMAPHFARELDVPYAIIAASDLRSLNSGDALLKWAASFRHVLVIPDISGMPSLWVSAREVGGLLGMEVRQDLTRPSARFLKRLCDIAVSGAALAALAPLLMLIYVAVRVFSPGRALYHQMRLGRNEQAFKAWKFRTMAADSEAILLRMLREDPVRRMEYERYRKLKDDPRVTPIGRVLRKTSLDELPQLWNIFIGDMSLVGPRPILAREIVQYGDLIDVYSRVRPGLTGLWQISGRNHTAFDERVKFDDYYLRNWSLWLDLYILFRTIKTVALGEGAY